MVIKIPSKKSSVDGGLLFCYLFLWEGALTTWIKSAFLCKAVFCQASKLSGFG